MIIPDDAQVEVRILSASYYDIDGVDVAPSKGNLYRHEYASPEAAPFSFDETIYEQDAFYPGPVASLRAPYILRDYRGVVVELNPLQYNAAKRILRVYTDVTVEIAAVGQGGRESAAQTPRRAEQVL